MKIKTVLLAVALAGTQAAAADIDIARVSYTQGDYARAHDYLLKAARQDNAEAQELLATMYLVGSDVFPGVHQDYTAAASLYSRAIRNGRTSSVPLYCALVRRGTLHVPGAVPCPQGQATNAAASIDPR